MKKKAWIKCLIGVVLIIAVLYLKGRVDVRLSEELQTTYQVNYFLFVVGILLNVVIGIILGMEHFLGEVGKEGKWRISIPKVIFLIIPSLYFSLFYFYSYIRVESILKIIFWPYLNIFSRTNTFIFIFQIVLGYSLITVFYKAKKIKVLGENILDVEGNYGEEEHSLLDEEVKDYEFEAEAIEENAEEIEAERTEVNKVGIDEDVTELEGFEETVHQYVYEESTEDEAAEEKDLS